MKGKIYFIFGIFCLISLSRGVPLEDNKVAISIESHDLTEDEIYAKIAAMHNKLEEDLKSLDEGAKEGRKKLEERRIKLQDDYQPIFDAFDVIATDGAKKLKELKYPELREEKKKLAENSRDRLQNVEKLGAKFRQAKDEYLKEKRNCNGIFQEMQNLEQNDCETKLRQLKEISEKANENLSKALDELKAKHQEANELYDKIEEADNKMKEWNLEVYNREKEIYMKIDEVTNKSVELMMKGLENQEKLENDKKNLREKVKMKIRKLLPHLTLKWVRWSSYKSILPTNAVAAGNDIDNSVLYVARRKKLYGFDFEYGKCANARDCFVTDNSNEKGAIYVDVSEV